MKEKEEKVEQQGIKNQESRVLQICKSLDGILEKLLNRKQYFLILSMVIYALYFVFYVEEYPDYTLEDILGFAMFYLSWFMALALILYFPFEVSLLMLSADLANQQKNRRKLRFTISGIFVVFFMFALFLLTAIAMFSFVDRKVFVMQNLWVVLLIIVYIWLLVLIYFDYKNNDLRIMFMFAIVTYLVLSHVSIMQRTGIGDYKADVMVYTNDEIVDYLKECGIDINVKPCYENNKTEEGNTKKLKICKTAKGNLRFNNIKVLSSIGKKTFLEYNLDEDNKKKLIFDTKQVKILEKFNLIFKII